MNASPVREERYLYIPELPLHPEVNNPPPELGPWASDRKAVVFEALAQPWRGLSETYRPKHNLVGPVSI